MTHGSLFSGIGGFDLAAEWMGWTNVFHCEWNPFGQKVLKHYWPDAISYTDITKTDFSKHYGTIDIISGGFPCQPYSTAGKRLGKEDERHLWPQMLRAIREVSPRYVVGENVRGLTNWNGGVVFDEVQADMEAEGYEVLPFLLPACGVGAPHRRDRIWFIAHAKGAGMHREKGNVREADGRQGAGLLPESEQPGSGYGGEGVAAHACSDVYAGGLDAGRNQQEKTGGKGKDEQPGGWDENGQRLRAELGTGGKAIAHPGRKGGRQGISKVQPEQPTGERVNGPGLQRYATNAGGIAGTWGKFPTESPLCVRNDGLSFGLDTSTISFPGWRKESIKAAGNAIVPQVALQIFKAIEQYEMLISEQEQERSVANTLNQGTKS